MGPPVKPEDDGGVRRTTVESTCGVVVVNFRQQP